MQINEQELAEAIETISEGGQALGVSCEDVYRRMLTLPLHTQISPDHVRTIAGYVVHIVGDN